MEGLTGRLFQLADLLQAHERLTTPELAARLGVSERTVRRDVARLQDLELPVEMTPGRRGGVSLKPGSLLPALRFTDDEALALGFGLTLARRAEGMALSDAAERAFNRLGGVLGERLRARLAALGEVLSEPPAEAPTVPASAAVVESGLLLDVAEAAAARRLLELSYRTKGSVTTRRVEPYGLVHLNGFWYLPGYCHLRRAVRVFRLDRVRYAHTLSGTFAPPAEFDALDTVGRAIAGTPFPGAVTCHVYLGCSVALASRLIPAGAVLLEPEDVGVTLRFHVPPAKLREIALYLLGFPFDVRVIGPEALREALGVVSQRALALSEGS